MRPLLGDVELLELLPLNNPPRPGDLIVYRNEAGSHLHRVWWRRGRTLWVKDDTGSVALHSIDEGLVLGRPDTPGLFTRGWSGWLYSLFMTAIFTMGRRLKGRSRP